MKNSVLALVAIVVLLGSAFVTGAKAATWTFRPELVRLDGDNNPLPEDPADVTRADTLRVGLYVNVTTDGVNPIDDSNLGFDSLSGAIHFITSDELEITDIGPVVRTLRRGVTWERHLTDANTTFSPGADSFLGPPEDELNEDFWIFVWDDAIGAGDPKGAWCVPDPGECTIFVGVLTVPLSELPPGAAGGLSLTVAGVSRDEGISVRSIRGRGGEPEVEAGNTITYNICPDTGCPMAPGTVAVGFAQSSYSVTEGGAVVVTVTLSEPSSQDVTVPVQATGSTASAVQLSAGTVTFTAGDTSQIITVTARENDEDAAGAGADETTMVVELGFGALPDLVILGDQAVTMIQIADNDDPLVTVSFGADMYTAAEGGASATVSVNVTPAPERAVTIPLNVQYENGATAGDVSGVPGTVTFAADQQSATFAVTAVQETDVDPGESLTLSFGTLPPGVERGVPNSASVSLRNDDEEAMDEPLLVYISGSPEAMAEGGMLSVEVSVNSAPAADLTVRYALSPGTAVPGDYRDEDGGGVTIASGETTATITVAVVDDNLSERDETFTLTLMEVMSADPELQMAALDAQRMTTLRILDNDPLTVSLTGPAMAREGTEATYTVSLAGGVSTEDVMASVMRDAISTADASDLDGDSLLPMTVTVPEGQSSRTFMLGFINNEDGKDEDEVLVVRLDGVTGGGGDISVDPSADTVETTITETNLAQRGQAMKHVLAAFGRTVASNMVGLVESRAAASRSAAVNISQLTIAGQSLSSDQPVTIAGKSRSSDQQLTLAGESPSSDQQLTLAGESLSSDQQLTFAGKSLSSDQLEDGSRLGEGGDKSQHESQQARLVLAQTLQRLLRAKTDEHGGVTLHPVSGRELLTGSSFQLPMAGGAGSSTVWGRGASAGFEGEGESGFSMDGGVLSGHVGLDFHPFEDVLAGFAVGYNEGTSDYRFAGGTQGEIDTTLTTYTPYAHWSFQAGLGVWAMLGYGQGEATLDDGDSAPVETDVEMRMAAMGGRKALSSLMGFNWALKADAFFVRFESEGRDLLPAADGNSSRLRLALESARDVRLAGGATLKGTFELGGRMDGGDAGEGAGTDVGGGIAYVDPNLGLNVAARGRVLVAHRASGLQEWGASLTAKYDPGVAGRGFHASLAPAWGKASNGADELWKDVQTNYADDSREIVNPDMTMKAQAGYGLGVLGDRGLLTPFGELNMLDEKSRVRLGTNLKLSAPRNVVFQFGVYGEREYGAEETQNPRNTKMVFESRVRRNFAAGLGAVELFSKVQSDDREDDFEVGLKARIRF